MEGVVAEGCPWEGPGSVEAGSEADSEAEDEVDRGSDSEVFCETFGGGGPVCLSYMMSVVLGYGIL